MLLDLWEYLTRTFKLNEIHTDENVTLEVNDESLILKLSSGNVYESGEFLEIREGEGIRVFIDNACMQ